MTVLGNFFDDPSNVLWMAYTGMIFIGMLYGYAFARLMRWMDERPSKSFKALEGKLFSARCAAEFLREGNFDQAAAVDRLGLIETSLLLLEDLGFKTPYELPWQVILGTEKGRDLLFVYFASLAAYAEEGRVVEAKQLSKDFTQQASTMDFS